MSTQQTYSMHIMGISDLAFGCKLVPRKCKLLLFCGRFCATGTINGPNDLYYKIEMEDETL